MEKLVLTGLFPEEITERLSIPQSFRGKQIFKWISSHATDFSQMTNLSKEFREELEQKAVIRSSKVNLVLKDPDGTVKLQIKLFDGLFIETVLLSGLTQASSCLHRKVQSPDERRNIILIFDHN